MTVGEYGHGYRQEQAMYTCSCSCTRTCTCRLWLGPGCTGACGMEGVPREEVWAGQGWRLPSTEHTHASKAWQASLANKFLGTWAGWGPSKREGEYSVYSQATDDLPRSSPGCSLLTAPFVCRVTAHVEMHMARCCKTGDFSPGGVLFPGPKNDAAVA